MCLRGWAVILHKKIKKLILLSQARNINYQLLWPSFPWDHCYNTGDNTFNVLCEKSFIFVI